LLCSQATNIIAVNLRLGNSLRRYTVPKTVLQELAEADAMHALSVKMKAQKDTTSSAALDRKVTAKRKKAIARMGKVVRKGGGKKAVI